MTLFRLAHLSDIHFGGENVDAVAAASDLLRREAFDLIIISGDLTALGEVAEFEKAAAWLATLPPSRLVAPGNHDTPYLAWMDRLTGPFRRFETHVGPAGSQEWRAPGVCVRGINTARGVQPRLNWSKGQISARQVKRTIEAFRPADQLRIVVVHHPLIEMLGGPMTARVWGGPTAAGRFAEAKIDLVLSGHIHAPFTWPYPCGDGRTYAVGAGTLSVRERGVPPGFNIIEADDAEFRVTALGWKGHVFEPLRTTALIRRNAEAPADLANHTSAA